MRRRAQDEEDGGDLLEENEERTAFLNNGHHGTTTTNGRHRRHPHNDAATDDSVDSTSSMHNYGDVLEADEEEKKASHGHRLCWSFRVVVILSMLCVVTIATLLVMLPSSSSSSSDTSSRTKHNVGYYGRSQARGGDGYGPPVRYSCPAVVAPALNDNNESFEREYAQETRNMTTNITEFAKALRDTKFDGWGRSYETVKAGMYHFKSKYYHPYLKNGSSIYESACGIGLNLYMTLEILQERGVQDLVVYGNEYVPESANKADWVLSNIAPGNAKVGSICPGDSSNLSVVPSQSMDLVYSGYVTPVMDPLQLGTANEDYTEYKAMCRMVKYTGTENAGAVSGGYDWMGVKLNEIVQAEQERWYGNWVAEMTRIAKPGAPVLVEQVSPAYCTKLSDWGGVDQEYWNRTATLNTYHWNVDPSSIKIEMDTIFKKRYHVFMLKNK